MIIPGKLKSRLKGMENMTNKINLNKPVTPIDYNIPSSKNISKKNNANLSFTDVLKNELSRSSTELKFSLHAQHRIEQNGLKFGPEQLAKITRAVEKASQKGSKDSLVLMDEAALVVSVKNNTVITVVDSERMKDNVFTNIDSAVII
jgi:flagellar operon protein